MNNKSCDSNFDFSRFYTSDPAAADPDASSRETGEWQFDGVTMSLEPADSSSWHFEQSNDPPVLDDQSCHVDGISFGLSCREIGEWQYLHADETNAKQKLLADSTTEAAPAANGKLGLSPLQQELSKWLPAT